LLRPENLPPKYILKTESNMKKALLKLAAVVGLLSLATGAAWAQQIEVSAKLQDTINTHLAQPVSVFTLDTVAAARLDTAIQSWIAGKTGLRTVKVRESRRYPGRVTYALQPIVAEADADVDSASPEMIIQPIINPIIFRKAVNYFSYRQFPVEPVLTKLVKLDAIKLANDFLVNRKMVELSQQDNHDEGVVREFRRDSDLGDGGAGKQELLMQGVVFSRLFKGNPVINSRILVDLNPDTKEVLGLKHLNWTPVLTQPRVTTLRVVHKSLDDILAALQAKAPRMLGRDRRASLSGITPAWFQTDKELLPILLCHITYPHDDHVDGYSQPINLAGNDSEMLPTAMATRPPSTAVPEELKLISPRWLAADTFTFGVAGQFTDSFVLEAAKNITGDWVAVATNSLAVGQVNYTNTVSSEQRYFRAKSLP
jgi:hypothetical protein